jgi:UDP-N-acetylglucosamine--N-acetylmuramyl-(pentapeptide) pyrophosphoryl-undecaprenol N-acetylglucosamine transferase
MIWRTEMALRVLLTGGGTGGHINPALAIADIIKMNVPDAHIAFVGTEKGLENRLVPKENYKLYHIEIQGIKRSFSLSNVKTAYLVLTSPSKAKKIIQEFKPDIVIGTGGYVCWPLLKAASSMGIPTMVHESNALPGVAVRQLQKKVDVILTNFKATEELLDTDKKIVNVGNPLRKTYATVDREEARKKLCIDSSKFVILSFGGSLGAQRVNEAAVNVMRNFSSKKEDVIHYHSGGSRGYENAMRLFVGYGLEKDESLVLKDYIYDMPLYMAAADLVICRAGAMTLTEIAMMKKAAILIPSPNVADNHQYKNAKVLADAGAAMLIEEKDLNEESITKAVEQLYSDASMRKKMEEAISVFCNRDAGKLIYEEMSSLLSINEKIVKND